MQDLNRIIEHLTVSAKPFKEILSYSDKPGIYAFVFYGKNFPLNGYALSKDKIIYIGKTESSQESRDLKTHFKSDKTGSSTIRRSLGALLKEQLQLLPVPRNKVDLAAKRLSQFKFDRVSEERLTEWMKENLGLSFYPYLENVSEIDTLETEIIAHYKPVLNIDWKNPANPHAAYIKKQRKLTADEANRNANLKEELSFLSVPENIPDSVLSGKYKQIWEDQLNEFHVFIKSAEKTKQLQLEKLLFESVGNRKSYTFNLVLVDGKVKNNIKGCAVAKDLAKTLLNNQNCSKLLKDSSIKINMNKNFHLTIKKY